MATAAKSKGRDLERYRQSVAEEVSRDADGFVFKQGRRGAPKKLALWVAPFVMAMPACSLLVDTSGIADGRRVSDARLEDVDSRDANAAEDGEADPDDGGAHPFQACPNATPQTPAGFALFFCDDFSDGARLGLGWTRFDRPMPSTAAVESEALSAPGAFVTSTPPLSAEAGGTRMRLQKNVNNDVREVRFAFAYRVELVHDGPQSLPLAILRFGSNPGGEYGFHFLVSREGPRLNEVTPNADGGVPDYREFSLPPAALGEWHRVDLQVELVDGPPADSVLRASFEGAPPISFGSVRAARFWAHPVIEMGLLSVKAPSTGWRVRFDDVAVLMR